MNSLQFRGRRRILLARDFAQQLIAEKLVAGQGFAGVQQEAAVSGRRLGRIVILNYTPTPRTLHKKTNKKKKEITKENEKEIM